MAPVRLILLLLGAISLPLHAPPVFKDPAKLGSLNYHFPGGASSSLNTGLRGYWKLDEASGTRNDSAGVSHLTDNNTVLATAAKINDGANFVAADSEFLHCADSAPLSLGVGVNWSFAFWVNTTGCASFSRGLISKWDDSGGDNEYLIYYDGGSDLIAMLLIGNDNTQYGPFVSTDTIPVDTTAFVVVRYNGSTIEIHINDDGTPSSTAHTQGVRDSTSTFRMGVANEGLAWLHNSWLDEVGLWNKALSVSEMTELYNSGNGKTCCPF